jgi:hypothetical protein
MPGPGVTSRPGLACQPVLGSTWGPNEASREQSKPWAKPREPKARAGACCAKDVQRVEKVKVSRMQSWHMPRPGPLISPSFLARRTLKYHAPPYPHLQVAATALALESPKHRWPTPQVCATSN